MPIYFLRFLGILGQNINIQSQHNDGILAYNKKIKLSPQIFPLSIFYMSNSTETPLSENELIELDNFLLSIADDESLSIDEAHGFLTALVVSHHHIQLEEWLEYVWGEPDFESTEQEAYYTQLVKRMYAEITDSLEQGKSFEPLVAEMEEEGEVYVEYEGWCFGFMMALAQEQEKWDSLPKDQQELLTPIGELALAYVEEGVEIDDEEYGMLVDLIPGSVVSLYEYWQQTATATIH